MREKIVLDGMAAWLSVRRQVRDPKADSFFVITAYQLRGKLPPCRSPAAKEKYGSAGNGPD